MGIGDLDSIPKQHIFIIFNNINYVKKNIDNFELLYFTENDN